MRVKKRKAVTSAKATAQNCNRQNELYRTFEPKSSRKLKQEVGELLFCLEFPVGWQLRQFGWGLLERLLCRYIDSTRLSQGVSHKPGLPKPEQRVSG
jgi:hypothetical protein